MLVTQEMKGGSELNEALSHLETMRCLERKGSLCPGKEELFFVGFFKIYFWLCWVFVAACGLSLVVASAGYSLLRCAGSVVVAHGLSCSAACGIFPDQGSNPCPLHWQADS